jgi:hypothetical protein
MISNVPFSKPVIQDSPEIDVRRGHYATMYIKALELAKQLRDAKRQLRRAINMTRIRVDVDDLIRKVQATIDEAQFNGEDPSDAVGDLLVPIPTTTHPSADQMETINRLLQETDAALRSPERDAHTSVETPVQVAERQAANRKAFEEHQVAERQAANRKAFEKHQARLLESEVRAAYDDANAMPVERKYSNGFSAAVKKHLELTDSGLQAAVAYVKSMGLL